MLVKICFWLHRVPGLLNTVWDLDFPRRVYSWVLRVETILLSSRGGEGLGLTEDAEDGRRMRKRMDAQQSHPRIWGGGGQTSHNSVWKMMGQFCIKDRLSFNFFHSSRNIFSYKF